MIVNLRQLDCTTYVENVLALWRFMCTENKKHRHLVDSVIISECLDTKEEKWITLPVRTTLQRGFRQHKTWLRS